MLKQGETSKVLTSQELVTHIGKTRAKALFNHPFYKKHVGQYSSHSAVGHKVVTDDKGFTHIISSSNFTFDHKGQKVRKMVRSDVYKHRITNAHLFHNYDNERHRAEHGGGPVWQWKESYKKDDE